MTEHQLLFHSMPRVCFAHRYDTDHYDIRHTPHPGLIEITYILRGGSHIRTEDEEYDIPCDSAHVSVYDHTYHFSYPGYHQHTTVGIQVDYTRVTGSGILLPSALTFDTENNPVRLLIEQLVLQFSLNPDHPRTAALLFELLGKISDQYQTELQKRQAFGKEWYVNRAKQYIIENIANSPKVADTARHLDISAGYLSHIFTEITGQTLTRYVNTVRLKRVEELVLTYGMDLRQAGESVGLSDPNYTSRLFRKIQGCSLSDLRHARKTDPPGSSRDSD